MNQSGFNIDILIYENFKIGIVQILTLQNRTLPTLRICHTLLYKKVNLIILLKTE